MNDTAAIPFTQYMRPDGRRVPVSIERPVAVANAARDIIARGYRFEVEVLMTGECSFTIYDPILEDDVVYEIVPNGPEILAAVDRLVEAGSRLPPPGTEPTEADQ